MREGAGHRHAWKPNGAIMRQQPEVSTKGKIETALSVMGLRKGTLAWEIFVKLLVAGIVTLIIGLILWATNISEGIVQVGIHISEEAEGKPKIVIASWLKYWVALSPIIVVLLYAMLHRALARLQEGRADPDFVSELYKGLAFLWSTLKPGTFSYRNIEWHLTIGKSPERDRVHYEGEIGEVAKGELHFAALEFGSTHPVEHFPKIEPQSNVGDVTYLPYTNERTRKRFMLIFRPGLKAGDRFWCDFAWMGYWNDLRKGGEDFFEYQTITKPDRVTVVIDSETDEELEWTTATRALQAEKGGNKVRLFNGRSGTRLIAEIHGANLGENFRLSFQKKGRAAG